MGEIWQDIQSIENFQISNFGRIRKTHPKTVIITKGFIKGRESAVIRIGKKYKRIYINRLMALAFIPNPKNYPDVLHYNGDTTDNSIENLYWGKRVRKGCQLNGENHGRRLLNIEQIKEIRHQRSLGWSFAELALKYNVSIGCIQGVLTKTWKKVE